MSKLTNELGKPLREMFYFFIAIIGIMIGTVTYGIFSALKKINRRKDDA